MKNLLLAFITLGLASCEVNIQGPDTQDLENLDTQQFALNEDTLQEDESQNSAIEDINLNEGQECFHTLLVDKTKQEKIDKQFLQSFRQMSERQKERTRKTIINILQEIETMEREEANAFIDTLQKPLPSCSLFIEIFDISEDTL